MNYRRYNWLLLGGLGPVMLFVLAVSLFTGPIDGDLTRIGGLSEQEYGWNSTQPAMASEYLFHIAHSLDEWTTDYDVVVLGDSFTLRPHTSWASQLHLLTGASIIFFHQNDFSMQDLLSSSGYRDHPPELLVFESVERSAAERLARTKIEPRSLQPVKTPVAESRSLISSGTASSDLHVESINTSRPTHYSSFQRRISDNLHIIKTQLKLKLFGERSKVVPLALENRECPPFSSRNQDEMLILRSALEKRLQTQDRAAAAENLKQLAQAVSASGHTRFVALVFPDKLTVYAPLARDKRWVGTSLIPGLAEHSPMPRLDLAYQNAVAQCQQDIYLPNNTHTGGTGSLMAVRVLLNHLKGVGEPDLGLTAGISQGRTQ